jgi:hypothetical protein
MGSIRPLTQQDFDSVADLHRRVFRTAEELTPSLLAAYRSWLAELFLPAGITEGASASLVHEQDDGKITGFLGVVPASFLVNGKPAMAAIATQFIVDPSGRSGMAALHLLKTLFGGPQDLTFADEANDGSRAVWEGVGGTTSLLHSIHWTRVLKPFAVALEQLKKRGGAPALAQISRPFAGLADSIATRLPQNEILRRAPEGTSEDTDVPGLAECLAGITARHAVRPCHDPDSLTRGLALAARHDTHGRLRCLRVKNAQGVVVGCGVYFVKPGGLSEVLLLAAKKNHTSLVFAHVTREAWSAGCAAIVGRFEPDFLRATSDAYCLYQRGRPWTLIQSWDPAILNAFHRGDVFLSRLDGEFCFRFR